MAAYSAFAMVSAGRAGEMPPWDALPPEVREDWRAVADAVQMISAPPGQPAALPPPGALTAAIASLSRHSDTNLWLTAAEGTIGGLLARKELLTRALHAAAPHLVAAERERCAELVSREAAIYEGDAASILYDIAELLRQEPGPGEAGHPGPQAGSDEMSSHDGGNRE